MWDKIAAFLYTSDKQDIISSLTTRYTCKILLHVQVITKRQVPVQRRLQCTFQQDGKHATAYLYDAYYESPQRAPIKSFLYEFPNTPFPSLYVPNLNYNYYIFNGSRDIPTKKSS